MYALLVCIVHFMFVNRTSFIKIVNTRREIIHLYSMLLSLLLRFFISVSVLVLERVLRRDS